MHPCNGIPNCFNLSCWSWCQHSSGPRLRYNRGWTCICRRVATAGGLSMCNTWRMRCRVMRQLGYRTRNWISVNCAPGSSALACCCACTACINSSSVGRCSWWRVKLNSDSARCEVRILTLRRHVRTSRSWAARCDDWLATVEANLPIVQHFIIVWQLTGRIAKSIIVLSWLTIK